MTRRTMRQRLIVGLASLGLLTSVIGPAVAVAAGRQANHPKTRRRKFTDRSRALGRLPEARPPR